MNLIVDEHSIAYFDKLPDGARLATLDDFHHNRKRHSNMPFMCYSPISGHYVIYRFIDSIAAGRMKFFVDLGLIFVFRPVPQCVIDYYTNY